MHRFIAFSVWLVFILPAAVIADGSVDGFSTNPLKSPSEAGNSNQFDADLGSDLMTSTNTDCAPDNIQNTAQLRARLIDCVPPKTSNDRNGQNPTKEGEEIPQDPNDQNGHNPKPSIWLPPTPLFPLLVPESSEICPPPEFSSIQYLICHEGPDTEIQADGEWIQNAISCMSHIFPFSIGAVS